MNSTNIDEFTELMAGLGEIYDKSMTKVINEIYWEALKPYSIENIKKAVNNIVTTRKYPGFPKPAEFIEYIDPPEDADAKAELMLEEFFERMSGSGYVSFEWSDPVLAMTVDHYGGWRKVLEIYPTSDFEQEKFWLIDFKKTYKIFLKYPRPANMRVTGTFEIDNQSKGFLTDEIGQVIPVPGGEGFIRIGSPEAQKYLESKEQKLLEVKHESKD